MELSDFAGLLMLAVILLFPFGIIYLILNTLNWNNKKNIFLDSWAVFIAWIVSGLLLFAVCAICDAIWRLSGFSGFAAFVSMYVVIGFGNLISIFGVLYIRSRQNVTLINPNGKEIEAPSVRKTLQATFAVYFLTLLMTFGLTMAMTDIDEKYFQPKQGEIQFGIYD